MRASRIPPNPSWSLDPNSHGHLCWALPASVTWPCASCSWDCQLLSLNSSVSTSLLPPTNHNPAPIAWPAPTPLGSGSALLLCVNPSLSAFFSLGFLPTSPRLWGAPDACECLFPGCQGPLPAQESQRPGLWSAACPPPQGCLQGSWTLLQCHSGSFRGSCPCRGVLARSACVCVCCTNLPLAD